MEMSIDGELSLPGCRPVGLVVPRLDQVTKQAREKSCVVFFVFFFPFYPIDSWAYCCLRGESPLLVGSHRSVGVAGLTPLFLTPIAFVLRLRCLSSSAHHEQTNLQAQVCCCCCCCGRARRTPSHPSFTPVVEPRGEPLSKARTVRPESLACMHPL